MLILDHEKLKFESHLMMCWIKQNNSFSNTFIAFIEYNISIFRFL